MTRTAALAVLGLALAAPAGAQEVSGTATAMDGDALRIGNALVRLWGVDAPERGQPCFLSGQPWECQPNAFRQLQILVDEGPVTCRQMAPPDEYRRMIAVCEVGGRDLNEAMVRSGLALAYPDESTDYVAAEEAARAEGIGLWAGAEFELPWEFRARRRDS